jgi:flagellar hook-associated protein 2
MPSFGFGTITSQGVGSNINISGIVSSLMEIERIPLDRLIAQKQSFDAKISSLGSIKSSLSLFQSALAAVTSGSGIQANTASSSNTSIATATASSGAIAGNYSLEVTNLASSQKLVAAGQADATAAIGTGTTTTLTIDLGTITGGTLTAGKYTGASFDTGTTPSFDVIIDSSNNTLEGIRDAINTANQGVTATIVNDGGATPYRLVLSSSDSGADQSIQISVAGEADIANLLAHDPANDTGQNLTENVTAADALFSVDGISITKPSNTVTDVISGVTLGLTGENPGAPISISVGQDTDAAKTAVENFVTAYNDLRELINTETDPGSITDEIEGGALASDSATRSILNYIRSELTQAPTGLTGSYTNLSSIGVSFQSDGTLAVDSSKLSDAINNDSAGVAELFSSTDGYGTRLDAILEDMVKYNGEIDARTNAFNDRIDLLDDRQATLEAALARTESRIRARFTALDVLVNSMNITSSYLTQQLDILNAQTGG